LKCPASQNIVVYTITSDYIMHLHMQIIYERLEQLARLLSRSVAVGLVQSSIFTWQVSQVCYTAAQHL
jgi:hypothetical protein